MAKVKHPTTLSRAFNIDKGVLERLGVLDVTLAIDTKLFIDPLLLSRSQHLEIKNQAVQLYYSHFDTIIRLLVNRKIQGDIAWKSAEKMLSFPEIKGTCLGYGSGSIHGSGFGPKLTKRILNVAAQIIDIGILDPDLFSAMALFESDVGPDRISDMTTNIIMKALSEFNSRVLAELKIKGNKFKSGQFLENPYEKNTPIILLPTDVLCKLPIAHDWDSIIVAAQRNTELREKINLHIASIWEKGAKRDKGLLRSQALNNKVAFETLLCAIKSTPCQPYDVLSDPDGLNIWATKGDEFAEKYPLNLQKNSTASLEEVFDIVKAIVFQFRHLIENHGLNKELYKSNQTPRNEATAQRLFFAVSYSYCKANNIDISPEIDTGSGKVDFKFSNGFDKKVLVEIKLSSNSKVVGGYKTQLEVYKAAEETMKAIYLVIDVGRMGDKDEKLIKLKNDAVIKKMPLSELEFVDGIIKPSASKRL